MNMVDSQSARANRILGALPMADYLNLAPHLEPVQVQAGQVIQAAGAACAHAHFPVDCAVTLVSATRDGETSELALIGREGVVGLPALLGASTTAMQSVVLRPGLAYRLPAAVFAQTLQNSGAMQALALRYVQSIMLQMAQGVVCSLHHSVLQRLSTWLLFHHQVTASDQVKATHETIAHMLGVRRESITQAAGQLQSAGCISTSRGRIHIRDAAALRDHVCECHAQVEQDHLQLWKPSLQEQVMAPLGTQALLDRPMPSAASDEEVCDEVAGASRYADIYDFAPVGLLSLDAQGRLIETNMAAAIQLGISRSQCRQYRFVDFLQVQSREAFGQFHREVLSGKCRRHCELGLQSGAHRPASVVRLDAVVDESGLESRMVMVDVTESHHQLAQLMHEQHHEDGRARPGGEVVAWWQPAMSAGLSERARTAHTASL